MSKEILKVKMRNNKIEVIVQEEAEYEKVKSHLFVKLDSLSHFLTRGKPKVLIAGKEFTEGQKRELTSVIKTDYNVSAVDFCTVEHLERIHKDQELEILKEQGLEQKPSSVFKFGRINHGDRVESDGDITIIGDVDMGAELVAAGSICVLGALRGNASAGVNGNKDAVIVAVTLEAHKLRIDKCVGVAPKDNKSIGAPEYAHIYDGNIVIEPVREESAFDDDERQKGIIGSIKRFFTYDH